MKRIFFSIFIIIISTGNIFGQADSLKVLDTRNVATSPSSYSRSLKVHFKTASVIGLPYAGYNTIIGLRGWADNSGGKTHELAFSNDSRVFFRSGLSPTWEAWKQILISDANGNYGIGTVTPTEKLSVKGKIRAQEVKVELAGWADFVFAKDYMLPTLAETEKHIQEKGHLPGIPSAAEVEKNGIELGDMNKKLLQKIEELTLYLIEQNKELTEQKKEIRELNKTVKDQSAEFTRKKEQIIRLQDLN